MSRKRRLRSCHPCGSTLYMDRRKRALNSLSRPAAGRCGGVSYGLVSRAGQLAITLNPTGVLSSTRALKRNRDPSAMAENTRSDVLEQARLPKTLLSNDQIWLVTFTTISPTSTTRPAGSSRSRIRLDRKCYLCPRRRNELSPMCPEWTVEKLAPRAGLEPATLRLTG